MSKIHSRSSWGARYVDGVGSRPARGLQKYLHHSVTKHLPATATIAQERAQCRVVEAIGQQRFGRGISYTFLIFPSGRIHQGASVGRISYHSGGGRDGKPRNTMGVGICLVGNTEANKMTAAQVAAVVWLLQEGVRRGWWGDPAITEGHRDFKATSCPGKHAYSRIGEMNRLARGGSYADFKKNGLPTGVVPVSAPKATPKKPKATSKPKVWPYTGLSSKAGRGTLNKAWSKLMADVGYDKGSTVARQQRWLADRGYYEGALDGIAGRWFVDALQGFLADRNYYKGARDAFRVPVSQSWGSWLKKAEIDYLNDQRLTYPQ